MNILLWIMITIFGLYVIVLAIATQGKDFKQYWQLLKADTVARTIMMITLALLIFQGSLVLFSFLPWRGILQWFCGLIILIFLCFLIARTTAFKNHQS